MSESLPEWPYTQEPLESSIERQAHIGLQAPFVRLWRAFLNGRVLLALALLLLQVVTLQLQGISSAGAWLVCGVYLALTLLLRWIAAHKPPPPQPSIRWLPVIGVDIAAIFLLQILQAGSLNYTALLAIPILISASLGGLLLAMGTAAAVTLLLLGHSTWVLSAGNGDATQSYYQTAFTGIGYFCVAYLSHELARRVRRERASSLHNQLRRHTQEQVNALVISHLTDGVLVLDFQAHVMQANPAALRMLGLSETHPAQFSLLERASWQPLVEVVHTSFAHTRPISTSVYLQHSEHEAVTGLDVRARITEVTAPPLDSDSPTTTPNHSLCVMFLRDLHEIQAQIRTEKLASMGRMSAAVAHEIRNPLAAITQANALLAEDLGAAPQQQQLSRIVAQNAERLARITEEILDVTRVQQTAPEDSSQFLPLDSQLALTCHEWQHHAQPPRQLVLRLQAPGQHIIFDEEHLRRVLTNLLDNAQRYRSHAQHAASLQVLSGHGQPQPANSPDSASGPSWLMVWSDGAPLESSVQEHLFEPFFSSQSRSSGLGLYICRELCQRYGASIRYQRLALDGVEGNAFIVSLRSAPQSGGERSLFDLIMV